MTDPIKHHYVPQFYLRHFANNRDQVRVVERTSPGRTYICPVRDVASERYFYKLETGSGASLELEKTLSEIESASRAALEGLIAQPFPPSAETREIIGFFVGLQWLRGRDQRDTYNHMADQFAKLILINQPKKALRKHFRDATGRDPTDAEIERLLKKFSATETYKVTPHQNKSIQQMLRMTPGLGRIASARAWQILKFSEPCLITSDSPVVAWTKPGHRDDSYSREGFGTCDEIRFPLDMRHALIMAAEAPAGEIVRDGSPEQARAFNYSIAANSYRRVFHHPDMSPLEGMSLPPTVESRLELDGPITRVVPDDD
ncbi:DUF4238 domain-containing protein [Archangium lipolyticum]|uniref:DUF4238 domain-containing protein n=1 Tax=Archangium lipolyticum TaxID=2970465 RepID=UPI002149B5F6|nr:DUF4238 domain-containing protein [Archangium lipolyticum]